MVQNIRDRSCFVLLLSTFLALVRIYSIISIFFTLYGCANMHADRDRICPLRIKYGFGATEIF